MPSDRWRKVVPQTSLQINRHERPARIDIRRQAARYPKELNTVKTLIISATCLLAFATNVANAHDVALYPMHGEDGVSLDIYYGDPGEYQPIDRVKFVELSSYDNSGTKISFVRDVEAVDSDPRKLITGKLRLGDFAAGTYVLSARYDNGFYIHDDENRAVSTTLEWKSDVIDSAHYQKFAKAVFFVEKPSSGFDRVLGHRVEFVLKGDPFTLRDGAMLPVLLLVDGEPMPDYKVEVGDDTAASKGPIVRTDKSGIFKVPLKHKGFYRLAVDYRAKSKYPTLFEFDDYTASLVFSR